MPIPGRRRALDLEPRGLEPAGEPVGGAIVAGAGLHAMEARQGAHGLERARVRNLLAQALEQTMEHGLSPGFSQRWRPAQRSALPSSRGAPYSTQRQASGRWNAPPSAGGRSTP